MRNPYFEQSGGSGKSEKLLFNLKLFTGRGTIPTTNACNCPTPRVVPGTKLYRHSPSPWPAAMTLPPPVQLPPSRGCLPPHRRADGDFPLQLVASMFRRQRTDVASQAYTCARPCRERRAGQQQPVGPFCSEDGGVVAQHEIKHLFLQHLRGGQTPAGGADPAPTDGHAEAAERRGAGRGRAEGALRRVHDRQEIILIIADGA